MQAMPLESDAREEPGQSNRDRRAWPRVPAADLQHVKARLATGGEITLKDLSRTGARLESSRRMLPNSTISLTLTAPDVNVVMTGLIVRSRIVRLEGGLGYDVAVSFHRILQALPGVSTPAADRVERASATDTVRPPEPPAPARPAAGGTSTPPPTGVPGRRVLPDLPALPPLPAVPTMPDGTDVAMLRVTADIENSESLRDLFDENGW